MENVVVLFTCRNRKEKTLACIESLKQNKVNLKFVVVDDDSNDGTHDALREITNVDLLHGDGNLFYSGGMRMGIEYIKSKKDTFYDYVLFINDDVKFYPNAIDQLISFNGETESIVVGSTCDDCGNLSYGGEKRVSKIRPAFKKVMSTESNTVYCDTFCANCVLIPKKIFLDLPNIDKKYIHAMGDFDYGFEAKRRGYKLVASSFFVGVCNDNDIVGTWRDTNLSRIERLRKKETVKALPKKEYFYYLRKNHGLLCAVIFSIVPYIKILLGK